MMRKRDDEMDIIITAEVGCYAVMLLFCNLVATCIGDRSAFSAQPVQGIVKFRYGRIGQSAGLAVVAQKKFVVKGWQVKGYEIASSGEGVALSFPYASDNIGIVGYLWCTQQAGAEGEIKGHALVAAALAKDFIGGISGDDGIDDVQALEGVGGISAGVAEDQG